jgi:hypothetical protein
LFVTGKIKKRLRNIPKPQSGDSVELLFDTAKRLIVPLNSGVSVCFTGKLKAQILRAARNKKRIVTGREAHRIASYQTCVFCASVAALQQKFVRQKPTFFVAQILLITLI